MKADDALMTLVLKLPHRPRSAVITKSSARPPAFGSLPLVEQRVRRRVDARREAVQHAQHLRGERPRLLNPLLRAAQLRRGDHLHRLGDLLRRLHRADAAADIK